MHMLLIANILIIKLVRGNPLLVMCCAQQGDEIALEVVAELVDELARIFPNDLHLADVRLGLDVAFEAVGVAALLLADLAPPAQTLQALGFHLVGDPFCAACFGFAHFEECAPAWLWFAMFASARGIPTSYVVKRRLDGGVWFRDRCIECWIVEFIGLS